VIDQAMMLQRSTALRFSGLRASGSVSGRRNRQARRARVAFLFNAQLHQVLHGATIADELAKRGDVDVDVLSPSWDHLACVADIVGPASYVRLQQIGGPLGAVLAWATGSVIPPKLFTLLHAARTLNRYDAIVLPERTSTILRWLGVGRPKLIHIDHGAGDREAGFDRRIAKFDFALVAGQKQRRRMLAEGLIRPDAHAAVGYPKFDAADRLRDRTWCPFAEARPIILYNPHFSRSLGSWETHGRALVAQLAASGLFNLIVAPHIRMCDSRRRRASMEAALAPFADLPNVHVDLGSRRSIDMTYTSMADAYIGDVSSQVYEFLRRPRPCLFLNAGKHAWEGDPNFRHWEYGPVCGGSDNWTAEVHAAIQSHEAYRSAQELGFAETFESIPKAASVLAADAIAAYLARVRS
jgi:hypothetical protein